MTGDKGGEDFIQDGVTVEWRSLSDVAAEVFATSAAKVRGSVDVILIGDLQVKSANQVMTCGR